METKSIAPETIVSGFAHFIWILLLSVLCLNIDIKDIFKDALEISSGVALLIASIAFGISHFLGTLFNRILSGLLKQAEKVKFIQKKIIRFSEEERQKILEVISKKPNEANDYFMSWGGRHFFLSMSIAIVMMIITSILLDNKITSGNNLIPILCIGILILVITVIAMFIEHNYFGEKRRTLLNKQNKSEKILSIKKNRLTKR